MPLDPIHFPDAVEKEVILRGNAATTLADWFGLYAPGSVFLPLSRNNSWAIYLLKKNSAQPLQNADGMPTWYNRLTYSTAPLAALSLSPYWLDLSTTGAKKEQAYAFNSTFIPTEPDETHADNPWRQLLLRLRKETPRAQWSAMEQNWQQPQQPPLAVRRYFESGETLELCIELSAVTEWGPNGPQEGYSLTLTAREQKPGAAPQTPKEGAVTMAEAIASIAQHTSMMARERGISLPLISREGKSLIMRRLIYTQRPTHIGTLISPLIYVATYDLTQGKFVSLEKLKPGAPAVLPEPWAFNAP
ncbi:MAG: hypothetical protein LBE21_00675, partial [Pseudomonadales bacterium]|nr:hypothetical protein [Pseudomonadales bacterium]